MAVDKWEKALVKFAHTYSVNDAWELERFGYQRISLELKLRLLKNLIESQFDFNEKLKKDINTKTASELRKDPREGFKLLFTLMRSSSSSLSLWQFAGVVILLSALLAMPEEGAGPVSLIMLVMSHCMESSSSSGMSSISSSLASFSGLINVSPKRRK